MSTSSDEGSPVTEKSSFAPLLGYGRSAHIIARAVVSRFIDNNDLLWASALTYTTALSIVPLLVLVFSILKGLGYTDQLAPVVTRYVGSPDIAAQLLSFVHNMKVAALGSIGGATLIITDISLLGTVENALNHSWGVRQGRSYIRKFTDYLSVTLVLPVLLVVALTITAGVTESASFLKGFTFIASFVLVWAGYFFLFIFFPNTKVKWPPALMGAFITAILWTIAQWAYVHFQYGVTSYRAYYGALAAIPVFLVWIYFSWAIVLLGVEFAVVFQRGVYTRLESETGADFVRHAVLLALIRIGQRMLRQGAPVTSGSIAHELGVPEDKFAPIVARLQETGLVADAQARERLKEWRELLFTRSPDTILLRDALEFGRKDDHQFEPNIGQMIYKVEEVEMKALGDMTVRDLIEGAEQLRSRTRRA